MAKKNRLSSRLNSEPVTSTEEVLTSPATPAVSADATADSSAKKKDRAQKRSRSKYSVNEPVAAELPPEDPYIGNDDFDAILEKDSNRKLESKVSRKGRFKFIPITLVITFCIYLVFLIYGVMYTEYAYNTSGDVVPVVYSVNDLELLSEYENIAGYYNRIQTLYADTLEIDADLAKNPHNSLVISLNYTELLDTVDKIVVDLNAAEYDSKYASIYKQFTVWTSTDIALYLQYMSAAIANNDPTAQANALVARTCVYNDFVVITKNLQTLASSIRGAEKYADFTWNPDQFYTKIMKGEG